MTLPVRRLKECVEAWPEAETGGFNPKCCRFPKSCSATIYDKKFVKEGDLEPEAEVRPEVKRPTLISMGVVVALKPGEELADYNWAQVVAEMGFRVCGMMSARVLDPRFDAPAVVDVHEDDPISFPAGTQFVSVTMPVLRIGSETPFHNEESEVTALIVHEDQAFTRPRAQVDAQDKRQGKLWTPGS